MTNGTAKGRERNARATGMAAQGMTLGRDSAERSSRSVAATQTTIGPCCHKARVAVDRTGEQKAKINAAPKPILTLWVVAIARRNTMAVATAHQKATVKASSSMLTAG